MPPSLRGESAHHPEPFGPLELLSLRLRSPVRRAPVRSLNDGVVAHRDAPVAADVERGAAGAWMKDDDAEEARAVQRGRERRWGGFAFTRA